MREAGVPGRYGRSVSSSISASATEIRGRLERTPSAPAEADLHGHLARVQPAHRQRRLEQRLVDVAAGRRQVARTHDDAKWVALLLLHARERRGAPDPGAARGQQHPAESAEPERRESYARHDQ
jgi:hypothetical protein